MNSSIVEKVKAVALLRLYSAIFRYCSGYFTLWNARLQQCVVNGHCHAILSTEQQVAGYLRFEG